MTQILTPDHERWNEFIDLLSGPQYVNFDSDEMGGNVTWNCNGSTRKPQATAILKTMPEFDLEATLRYFDEHGGHCDCEVCFNVDTRH